MSLTYAQRLRAKAASSPFPAEREAFSRKADEFERRDRASEHFAKRRVEWAAHYRECAAVTQRVEDSGFRPQYAKDRREIIGWCLDMARKWERGEML